MGADATHQLSDSSLDGRGLARPRTHVEQPDSSDSLSNAIQPWTRLPSAIVEKLDNDYLLPCARTVTNTRYRRSNHLLGDVWSRILQTWISSCIDLHRECGTRELASVFPETTDILLIDARRLCLVKAQTSHRYIALSYVWGQVPQYSTTSVNLEALLQPYSLLPVWDKIPRVVKEAIDLTDEIGERYIWVDSLCIVQDDASLKHHQLQLMAEIYNSATTTVIACAGSHADCRLVPTQCGPSTRTPPFSGGFPDYVEVRRPLHPKLVLEAIGSSYHSSRGWTYQERLLSRRCLYFLQDRVIFQCRADVFSHDGEQSVPRETLPLDPHFHPTYVGQAYLNATETYDRQKEEFARLLKLRHLSEWPQNMSPTDFHRGFDFWSKTIQEYSQKSFTFDEDVLVACSGILTAFQQYSTWRVFQGCPEPLLDYALLWVPLTKVIPRETSKEGENSLASWSWLKWKGGVHFPLSMKDRTLREIQSRLHKLSISSQHNDPMTGEIVLSHRNGTKLKARQKVLGFRIDIEHDRTYNWKKRFGLEYDDTQHIFTYDEIGDDSTNVAGEIGLTVRFISSEVPASTFLRREINIDMPVDLLHVVSQSVWLASSNEQRSHVCGILYGIDGEERTALRDELDNDPNSLSFILLSDVRLTPFTGVNDIIAPEFADETHAETCEVTLMRTTGHEPSTDAARVPQRNRSHSSSKMSTIPLGTFRNVMLVRWKGDRWAERVAIGQIKGAAWDEADAKTKEILLR